MERSRPMSQPDEGDVAIAEPIVVTESAPKNKVHASTQTRRQPPYHVILLNDEEHTFEYVIEMIVKVFGHSMTTAENLTWQVHNKGRAIALTTHRELAELKCEQVLSYGPDPRMSISKGPLRCYVEPAPAD
jgi:ATP-dependent Clp protease adaptor protein ClpS